MEKELIYKVRELQKKLELKKNKASIFFENIVSELKNSELKDQAMEKLKTCYSITQYADFSAAEDKLLEDILDLLSQK